MCFDDLAGDCEAGAAFVPGAGLVDTAPDRPNSTDNIFDSQLIVPLVADGDGYIGTFHVGVGAV